MAETNEKKKIKKNGAEIGNGLLPIEHEAGRWAGVGAGGRQRRWGTQAAEARRRWGAQASGTAWARGELAGTRARGRAS